MSDTIFEQMVNEMSAHKAPLEVWSGYIDADDYAQWKQDFIWEALHGQRYGQSFCNRFGIHDNHLFYNTGGVEWADEYIKKTYIERPKV
jgi:hypothetical protein